MNLKTLRERCFGSSEMRLGGLFGAADDGRRLGEAAIFEVHERDHLRLASRKRANRFPHRGVRKRRFLAERPPRRKASQRSCLVRVATTQRHCTVHDRAPDPRPRVVVAPDPGPISICGSERVLREVLSAVEPATQHERQAHDGPVLVSKEVLEIAVLAHNQPFVDSNRQLTRTSPQKRGTPATIFGTPQHREASHKPDASRPGDCTGTQRTPLEVGPGHRRPPRRPRLLDQLDDVEHLRGPAAATRRVPLSWTDVHRAFAVVRPHSPNCVTNS